MLDGGENRSDFIVRFKKHLYTAALCLCVNDSSGIVLIHPPIALYLYIWSFFYMWFSASGADVFF